MFKWRLTKEEEMEVKHAGLVVGEPGMSRDRWLQLRRSGIGSSDAPAVLGVNRYRTAHDVWLDKVKGPDPQDRDTLERKLGRLCEAGLADIYQEEIGREVLPPPAMLLRHRKWPWVLASLDGCTVVDGQPHVLEIKTVWRPDPEEEWGAFGSDEVPMSYLIQVQQQLAVTGWEVADLVAMFPGHSLGVYEVPRNEALIQTMLEMESRFWTKVQLREEPKMDWDSPRAAERVRRMYPGVSPEQEAQLGEEESFLASEIVKLSALRRENERELKSVRARLAHAMKESAYARLPNGYVVTRKVVSKKAYSVPAHEEVHLKVRPSALAKEAC